MVRSRLAVGLTQEQLAEMCGLSVRAISDIERGVTGRPRSGSAALLNSVLGLAEPEQQARPADRGQEAEPVVPRQLPQAIRGFTGRVNELGVLDNLLDRTGETAPGTVVISAIGGTAGVGKTALAVRWAHQVADRFPDGQLYVNLRGYDPRAPLPPADALAGFLRALGVPGVTSRPSRRSAPRCTAAFWPGGGCW